MIENHILEDYLCIWLSEEYDLVLRKNKLTQDLLLLTWEEERILLNKNPNLDEYMLKKKAFDKINKIISKELKIIQKEEYKLLYS